MGKTLTVDKYLVTVVAVERSGTISFVDGGSAQAVTGGVDAWLRRRASRRFRHHLGRSVGGSGGDSLGVRASAPPPPLYSAGAIGAHNPNGLGSPDQGAELRDQLGRWTESVEINTNILPLDLTFIL